MILRFGLIVVATAAYFALAIVGEGGSTTFFSHPPLLTLVILTLIMALAAFFADGNLSRGVREDRANRWVLIIFSLIGVLDGFLPAWSDGSNFWTFDGDLIRWIGVAIYAAGGALRIYPVFVLGRWFSGLVAIQPQHQLVTSGIYSVIRHPSYLGLIILMLGWGLAFRSAIGVVLAVLTIPLLSHASVQKKRFCMSTLDRNMTHIALAPHG